MAVLLHTSLLEEPGWREDLVTQVNVEGDGFHLSCLKFSTWEAWLNSSRKL